MTAILALAFAAVAVLTMAVSDALAQVPGSGAPDAPGPTFLITGFIDQVITYSNNTSNLDNDLHRKDYLFYGRTRGRFDIVGEYGKAKGVLGLEMDLIYGQTGTGNTNVANLGGTVTAPTGTVGTVFGFVDGSFSLNTDVRGAIEIKWLYTEFEVPYIPYPTIARLGAQPFAAAASYKLAAYASGDFAGANLVTSIARTLRLVGTFVAVEEMLVGRQQGTGSNFTQNGSSPVFGQNFLGVSPFQLRGDDWALIFAPEITPIKNLDLKPMYSYFTASGTTSLNARGQRGGISNTNWFQVTCFPGQPGPPGLPPIPPGEAWQSGPECSGNNSPGSWRKGIIENRHTIGLDARYRNGPFSLDPTVYYQFGNRSVIAPTLASGAFPLPFLDAGVSPGRKYTASLSAWFADIRAGYQLGPVLLEAMGMFTTGNSARDTTLRTVKYYQPLDADSGYLADWGGQLTALGVDYLDAMLEGNAIFPGGSIGWDKYGRIQLGARATFAWTPDFSVYGGWNGHWTPQAIQKNALQTGLGLIPVFTGQAANAKSNYIGNEIFGGLTWRFAPGLALDSAFGYMWVGPALDSIVVSTLSPHDARNSYVLSSRIRFSF